jgi:RND family efflux transporter MFP subunit
MKTFLTIGALLAAGGGGFWWWKSGADDAKGSAISGDGLFTVAKGDLAITLTENGTLVAKDSQKVVPTFRSRGKIVSIVEEGKVVAEGDELCKFDTTELQQQVDQAQLDITKAEADVQTAKTELEIQEKQSESDIKKARIALEKAQKEKEKYEEGDVPQEKRRLDIAIKEAKTAWEKAKQAAEDSKKLYEKDFFTKAELERDLQNFERAEIAKERAEVDLTIFEKYTLPMAMRDKQTGLEDAELALSTAQMRSESTLRQKQVAVEQAQKRLDKLNQQLKERQDELAKMILKAPCPGIVIYGDPRYTWDDFSQNLKVGGEIWGGNTLFTIPDLRVMQVKLQVHEADINKIKVDMATRVTMDTYPGVLINGKVTKIAAIATEGNQEVKKFDVEVTLEAVAEVELKPGISAKAEVMIDTRKDATYVPLQCVFLESGKHWCYTIDAVHQPQRVAVKPGLSNDSYLEILEGLEAGKQVLLYNPNVPTGAPAPDAKDEKAEVPPAAAPPAAPPAGPPAGA